ncbi:MAG: hypothetical protein FWG46_06540 [Treponema sp.]|nr:hypothetical protein [Treponema sp.]
MKKIIVTISLGAFALAILTAQAARGGTMYVAAKTIDLKSSTGFFASKKGSLAYGEQVTVLQVNGNWAEVHPSANASVSGWTSMAGLTAKRVVAGSAASASASEVALAGKGFGQEIENAYRSEGSLNYAEVDRMEAQKVSDREMYDFLAAGRLSMGE